MVAARGWDGVWIAGRSGLAEQVLGMTLAAFWIAPRLPAPGTTPRFGLQCSLALVKTRRLGDTMRLDRRLPRLLLLAGSAAWAQPPDGQALYNQHCAPCHAAPASTWALDRRFLRAMAPEAVLASMNVGMMQPLAAGLSADQKRAIVEYITGKALPSDKLEWPPQPKVKPCPADAAGAWAPLAGPRWIGWGVDSTNSRFQPAEMAGLAAEQVPRLKLKWAFGFPGANGSIGHPTIAGGRVFVGSLTGAVYALEAATGCAWWHYQASPAGVRSPILIAPWEGGRFVAYFGDLQGNFYALDAATGRELWKTRVDDHPWARITGGPQLHEGSLYVPVTSFEELAAADPKYECCTFRGSVVALDARTGKQVWKSYVIPDRPRPLRKSERGTQLWGPSGAGIWSSPTLDPRNRALYVATGDSYSEPAASNSDAVIALHLDTGKILWSRQTLKGDAWNISCLHPEAYNCPQQAGPDLDFGSSPILRALPGGRRVLLAGQKSGVLYALDPDRKGEVVWQARLGKGGLLGGIEWGPAADEKTVYVALSDLEPTRPEAGGGLFAIQIATGERLWFTPPPPPACAGRRGCSQAQPGAVTLIPGVLFSGSLDGHLRAYAASDGKILWDYDTLRSFETVNGVKASGGSLNGAGPTIAGGMLFANSGYPMLGMPGNVLLAFSVDGK